MLRPPQTKACLNRLRPVLTARDAGERTLCSRPPELFSPGPVSRASSLAPDSSRRAGPGARSLLRRPTNSPHAPDHASPSRSSTNPSRWQSSSNGSGVLSTAGLHRRAAGDECLSAGNEARCRRSLQANAALYAGERTSWAAVLVCLCAVSGDPALLFTLRSAKLKGRHKGDVSFAGGKKDPSDRTVVDTALREAREELGVLIAEDQVWGVLKPLRDVSGMMIAPVIANLGPLEALSFRPNPSGGDFYPDA
ncbi:nucleoside diphosphate-linked moiety X motif 8 isoform X2 [Puntigrus tetrazona]|uniref:nucleoside diphosphate-linked moiety X motif 8 isoform X2 n=1 Tax=Puntigrus tetrazona TaxID=1606681 RepID=UPI001C8A96E7|nr:nucleoside diphosphate-linked moiety X motif 8 isoform X2 [Puntigrus tetrazona]